ncbi:MAG: putative acyl-CoA dehydrogenase [Alphaproteobacteria bacterium]|jgi:SfnB family sulfur acquisition oxidoreductase|nr:putative acyl-CoA dehydrogenase [Alphaproteobacteria bacterium]
MQTGAAPRGPAAGISGAGQRSGADLVAEAAQLARTLAQGSIARDLDRVLPYAEAQTLRTMGLQTARVPKRYGGPEASFVEFAQMMMHLGEGDPNLAQMLQPHFVLMDWLVIDGSEAQRQRFFADVMNGHIITNALAERGGKTPGDFQTKLSRQGEGYRLNGVKFYSTGSLIADQLYVMARTEDGGHAITIVPKDRAGIEVIDDWDGMGQRTTGSGTTKLDNVEVSAEEVMPLPMHGKKRSYLGAASQIAHAAIDAGIALAALKDGVEYGRTKARPVADAGVDRATDDPYVQQAVGEMSVIAHGAEVMVLRAGVVLDQVLARHCSLSGEALEQAYAGASIAVAEAKAAANNASLQVSEMMFRVAGASATLRKYGLDRHWRNARTHTTHDPVAYKYRAIGQFMLNDTLPPISTKI